MTEPLNKPLVIVIAGPTAVGKTNLAIKVAQYFHTEIISCDSRQLFKELNIGVAKPNSEELSAVKHHFINSHTIHKDYNAGQYEKECNCTLQTLFEHHNIVVMTGGTGLYIKSALEGLDPLPLKNEKLRKELDILLTSKGMPALQEKAENLGLKPNIKGWDNPQRLIRLIEIEIGRDSLPQETNIKRDYNVQYFYINREREALYNRINTRVDNMIKNDLLKEVKGLIPHQNLNALQTVGYKELFAYFNKDYTLEFAISKIKQNTRNYAKRQLTWFRNQGTYIEIQPELEQVLQHIPN